MEWEDSYGLVHSFFISAEYRGCKYQVKELRVKEDDVVEAGSSLISFVEIF